MKPEDKIRIIENSVRCFWRGLLAFIPLAGLCFGVSALFLNARTRRLAKGHWNPAASRLKNGVILASYGLLLNLIVLIWFLVAVLPDALLPDL